MGLYDKPRVADASIKELLGPFLLVAIETRNVRTVYGENVAVDLYVAATEERRFTEDMREKDSLVLFSGFSAGIVRQAGQASPADFPTWAKIVRVPLEAGKHTTELAPVESPPNWMELPLEKLDVNGGDSEEDIPF